MKKIVKPIRFDEITQAKGEQIPDEIINAVNSLIVKKWNGTSATIKRDEILDIVVPKTGMEDSRILSAEEQVLTRETIFDNHYLDFEELYRKEGWKVVFDKPGYNETYDAYFKFSRGN